MANSFSIVTGLTCYRMIRLQDLTWPEKVGSMASAKVADVRCTQHT